MPGVFAASCYRLYWQLSLQSLAAQDYCLGKYARSRATAEVPLCTHVIISYALVKAPQKSLKPSWLVMHAYAPRALPRVIPASECRSFEQPSLQPESASNSQLKVPA